ncbi:MAG TPA: efflux RND transporter periplasmic adaptor subunit [Thermoleophilia bacterium]|nr:efflux RND transporter periplasmic adaptor subunit [Thermoleophilia bacterium]
MTLTRAAALAATLVLGCRRGPDASAIVASGHVEATDVRVATKVAGRLQTLLVQEGDRVRAGQELGRIDTTDIELALAQAKAERDQAAADLRLKLAGSRAEDIAEIAAEVGGARVELENAQRDLDRMQGLLDRGSGTTKARDDAQARRDVAAKRLAALEQSQARTQSGFRQEEKDAARAKLAALNARCAQLEQQLKDAIVLSPLDGVVTSKASEAGELLQVGTPLCVVTDLNDAWLTVFVSDRDLPLLRLGQQAHVVTDDGDKPGSGQRREGKITYVASEAEFTPKNVQTRDERVTLVYRIKVGLPNQDGLFKPGMPAEARFVPQDTR